uniref:Transposase (Putative), gypsy type n=1 Tax=Tanacetum cinerariifolium TaxID=118510 RepID=A0A6L2K2Z8_TANCI|nr:hypothetical protein [Tanacetum cinerariifolium]
MLLEESDDLNILDAEPVDLVLEASSLPKFDMHPHKSSLTDTHVKWLTTCYGIPVELHPRVASKGMTMDTLPNNAIRLYAHHFQQGVNRATYFEIYCRSLDITPTVHLFRVFYKLCKQGNWDAPIAMALRHHDFSVANPFPKPSKYDALDVAKLREVVIALHKPPSSFLYVAGLSHVWKHASRAFSLKDPKGKVVTMTEFLRLLNFYGCKVATGDLLPPGLAWVTHLANPVKLLKDLPLKTSDMVTAEIPCWKVLDDKEKKKRKVEVKAAANAPDADIQFEKTPVRLDSEHVSSPVPLNHAKPLESLANEEYVSPNVSVSRMGALRNQTDENATPSPIVNADKLVTGGEGTQENVDATFANEGHGDNEGGFSGLRTQHSPVHHLGNVHSNFLQNPLFCTYCPNGDHANLIYTHESCKDVKASYKECKKELTSLQSAFEEKVTTYDRLSKDYDADRNKQVEAELKQSKINAHQLRVDRERYSVECRNGEMVRRKIINEYLPTFAILTATPNVDPASPNIFMETYEKLFDKRYSYVDKVARVYLLDPNSLRNVMPDETGTTPGGGPRNTPTASYA